MAIKNHQIVIGVDVNTTNADQLSALTEQLNRLKKAAGGDVAGGAGAVKLANALAQAVRASTSYAKAQGQASTATTRLAAQQQAAEAALLRSSVAFDKARRAADAYAASQAAAARTKSLAELLASPQIREAGESIGQAGFAFQSFVTGPLAALARVSGQSALQIDANTNALRALTGSAGAAEARFQRLFVLVQQTPGLTTSLAQAVSTQLATARVSEQVTDRFLDTVGRLNAIQQIGDPNEFANNLRQLVDQGFDRADLKQVVNRNAVAGDLIRDVFGVDNPTNAEAIRASAQRLGINSAESFFDALAKAGANNPKLRAATESLAVQLEKQQDRLQVALRPLGLTLINAVIPAIEAAVPVVETLARAFGQLPAPIQALVVSLGLLAAGFGPALGLFGGFIQTFQVLQIKKVFDLAQGTAAVGASAGAAAGGLGVFTGALAGVRAALAATSAFLFTTPAGWALLAGAVVAAGAAYLLFNDSQKKVVQQADALNLADLTKQFDQVKKLQDQIGQAEALTGAQSSLNAEQERFNSILRSLTPQQQAVINSLSDQKAKVDELRASLRDNLQQQQGLAQAQQSLVVAAIAARQQEIDKTKEQITNLEKELRVRREIIRSGPEAGQQTIQNTSFGRDAGLTTFQQLVDSEQRLANERIKSGDALKTLNTAQDANIAKLKALLPVLNQTEDALLKEVQAGRLSAQEFEAFKRALDAARASAPGVASGANQVSAELALLEKRAKDARLAMESLFQGDATELRKQVTARVNEITGAALKAGGGVTGALNEFNKAIKDANDPLGQQVKQLQQFEAIQKALNDKVSPSKTGGAKRASVTKDALADIRGRDDALRAQLERELALAQDQNQRLQQLNQSQFDAGLQSLREFLARRQALQEAAADLELRNARQQAEQANADLLRLQQAQAKTRDKGQLQQLAREQDRVTAEIIRAQQEVTLAERRRADVGVQASFDLQQAYREEAETLREIEGRYLELTNQTRQAAGASIVAGNERQLAQLQREFAAVNAQLLNAGNSGTDAERGALEAQRQRLATAIEQTKEIQRQQLLNADFVELQRQLSEIDRQRSLALDEQNRRLDQTGASQDEATRQRQELMRAYQGQIDAVIERLKALQQQGAANPEIQRAIDDATNRTLNEQNISLDQRLAPYTAQIDRIFAERQRALDAVARATSLTDLEKEREKKLVIEQTNAQLQRQLDLMRAIFQAQGLPVSESFKELENRIRSTNVQTEDFNTTLRNTAQQAAIGSLTGFFTDLASGAKGFKEAALDALGSFIAALQQAVIQAIVLKIITAAFGLAGGGAAAQAGATPGARTGGAIGRLPRYAAGGSLQNNPVGFLRGPGGPKADKILAYFPAAGRFARVSSTEYVLDAQTTRNIGVPLLDRIRRSRGRNLKIEGLASGGAVATTAGAALVSETPSVTTGDTNVNLRQTIQLSPTELVRSAMRDRALVRDIIEVLGSERTRFSSTLQQA